MPEPLLLKISDSGSLLWLKKFPCGYGHGHRACEAADGGYLLVGQNQATMFLAKTDVDGEVLWEKSIKETAHNYIGFSLERTYDGGFIVVGTKDTYDVFLVKTDPDGNTSDTTQTISINDNSKAVIQNCIINNINNYGITVNNASPVISNNLIIQNKGGIKFTNSSPQHVVNNTIADNDSIGLCFDGNSDGQFVNNIIYGNKFKEVYINDNHANPAFYYNNIKGGQAQFGLNSGVTYTGPYANNISSDPLFSTGTYHLSTASPCIDAGYPGLTEHLLGTLYLPQTDILGNQRIFGSEIDMGCYEWNESGIEADNLICKFTLFQNYPNPFNPETIISYSIASDCHVTLKIYNLAGKEVATLVDKRHNKGIYEVTFKGDSFSSGMYFYKLSVDSKTVDTKKMLLLR